MKCANHPKKDAIGSCVNCGNLFCSSCLIKAKNKNYCKECAVDILGDKKESSKKETAINQQQQQQQQQQEEIAPSVNSSPGKSSTETLKTVLKWCIALFTLLMALGALASGAVISFVILLALGLYWIPPILDKVTLILNEKYKVVIPRWARIIGSIVLFIIAAIISV